MKTKILHKAKLIVKIESNQQTKLIQTISVYDNREQKYWTKEQIIERGIQSFINLSDLKESLNWNLNGDSSKYQFTWGQTVDKISEGVAYIFD